MYLLGLYFGVFIKLETGPLELLEEAKIIFKEKTDIIDAKFKHCDTFNAESKCKPCPFLRVVIDGLKNSGVYHSCTKNF